VRRDIAGTVFIVRRGGAPKGRGGGRKSCPHVIHRLFHRSVCGKAEIHVRRSELEVPRIPEILKAAAPGEPKGLAIRPQAVPPPPRDLIALDARYVNVESIAGEVGALFGERPAHSDELDLFGEAAPTGSDDERDAHFARCVQQFYRELADWWVQFREVARRWIRKLPR